MSLTPVVEIDLGAIVANWRAIDALTAPACQTAAVLEANAYGCGVGPVGRALARAGARDFFVAMPEEGAALRRVIGVGPRIWILGGYDAADRSIYDRNALFPVLNGPEQARAWFDGPKGPCAVHLDTGMSRLGLEEAELRALGPLPDCVVLMMSHLVVADVQQDPFNAKQLIAFQGMTAGVDIPRSLSATAGALLPPGFHFDMTRIGIGLYGGAPYNAGQGAVRVTAPVIQVRDIAPGEIVGYGKSWQATRPSRIATLSAGYADGLIRSMGNRGTAYLDGHPAPFAGRVSMDLITLDVTDCPDCKTGDMVELIGPNQGIDAAAEAAGSIGHEILTAIGDRYTRIYT